MQWFNITSKYHQKTFDHDGKLSSLPAEWQRELAALWRLEADVNNGAYIQFLCNWGRESYDYALQALEKIRAMHMARIVKQCQSLLDEHWVDRPLQQVLIRESLPQSVLDRIYDLSYEFMDYPDDIAELGIRYYSRYLSDETN